MNPASHAAMSGGWAVTGRRQGEGDHPPPIFRGPRGTSGSARSGAEEDRGNALPSLASALTARGPQAPASKKCNEPQADLEKKGSRRSVSIATAQPARGTDCRPETGLKWQPQERAVRPPTRGSSFASFAAVLACRWPDGTRDRLPPARGTIHLARGIVTGRPRPGIPPFAGSAGLGERSE
jgi:hypothetical protein